MKIPLIKNWWLWRYYLEKIAVYENTFIGDFPEPEFEPEQKKSVIVSAPAKKGGSGSATLQCAKAK